MVWKVMGVEPVLVTWRGREAEAPRLTEPKFRLVGVKVRGEGAPTLTRLTKSSEEVASEEMARAARWTPVLWGELVTEIAQELAAGRWCIHSGRRSPGWP